MYENEMVKIGSFHHFTGFITCGVILSLTDCTSSSSESPQLESSSESSDSSAILSLIPRQLLASSSKVSSVSLDNRGCVETVDTSDHDSLSMLCDDVIDTCDDVIDTSSDWKDSDVRLVEAFVHSSRRRCRMSSSKRTSLSSN